MQHLKSEPLLETVNRKIRAQEHLMMSLVKHLQESPEHFPLHLSRHMQLSLAAHFEWMSLLRLRDALEATETDKEGMEMLLYVLESSVDTARHMNRRTPGSTNAVANLVEDEERVAINKFVDWLDAMRKHHGYIPEVT